MVFGYGVDPFDCSATGRALRRSGTEVLGSLAGNVYDFIYGDEPAYLRSAVARTNLQRASVRYANGLLLPDYEAWVEPASGGTLTCKGDSGGPVLLERDGNLEVVGVISWSAWSLTEECDYGAVIAIFGPETRTFIKGFLEAP